MRARAFCPTGTRVGYLEQDPRFRGFATLGDFATARLGASEMWRVEAAAEGLDLTSTPAGPRLGRGAAARGAGAASGRGAGPDAAR
jgi:ATP-binding cassette subfamily F protein uup